MIALTYVRCKVARYLVIKELAIGRSFFAPRRSRLTPLGQKETDQVFLFFSNCTLFSKNVDIALGTQWNNTTCGAFKAF